MRTTAAMLAAFFLMAATISGADLTILGTGSAWRIHETWSTDVARMGTGQLIRVNPYKPRQDLVYKDEVLIAKKYAVRAAKRLEGSAPPADDWRDADFGDSRWTRVNGPFRGFSYRALSLLCMRGRFEVTDLSPWLGAGPAKAGELSLSVVFQGGLVVTLNGKEIGRSHLPAGKITPATLAEDYPPETYATPEGKLIQQRWYRGDTGVASWRIPKDLRAVWLAGYKKRSRTLAVKVPASALRKGVNVLALEVHRAPGAEIMFATVTQAGGFDRNLRRTYWWNRAQVETITLTAPAGTTGVASNSKPPKGFRVWNHPVYRRVNPRHWADPLAPLAPVRLVGARNGVYAGKVVVASDKPVTGLKVTPSALTGPVGATIPAAHVVVRYPRYERQSRYSASFDMLDASPQMDEKRPGNTQPVWVTVSVPADARGGDYIGTITVRAHGEEPVDVPIQLKVVNWTLPDPTDFTTHAGVIQSPETLAVKYHVDMWSAKHWQLIDRSFAMIAKLGGKSLFIPVKCRTHFGNPHTMVRWVKQPDGSHKLDFTLVEKYLDVATKHLGKIPVVCLAIYDGGPSNTKPDPPGTFVTEVNAAGKLQDLKAPDWGTPESRTFWKPLFDGMREVLKKRGLEKSLMVGLAQSVRWQAVQDLKAVAPDVPWVAHSHLYSEQFGRRHKTPGQPIRYLAQVGGTFSVFWDPADGRPFYGWRNPFRVVTYPRDDSGAGVGPCLRVTSGLSVYRLAAEGSILSGRQDRYPHKWGARAESMALKHGKSFPGLRGFGRLGADFWPVLESKRKTYPLAGRYPGSDWGTLSLKWVVPYLFAPGTDGATPTIRSEMLRESLQEAEARIRVQDALLDDDTREKLGKPRADRLEALCTARTRALRYISEFYDGGNGKLLLTPAWHDRSEALYTAAAEVAKILGN